ncbi:MAG: sulfite exporter TauE/SafE family protein [Candidatus Velthaea sp.]
MEVIAGVLYGCLVGLALGMTGGGGSIVTLPILVYLVGEKVSDAIGTSLAVVAGISLQGLYGQRDRLDWRTGLTLSIIGIAGSIPGSLLSQHVPGKVLLILFAAVMIVAAIAMLRARRTAVDDGTAPNRLMLVASGVALGFLTGFLGVGGGFLIVPTLMLVLRFPMQRAIPTSLLIIALNSIVSLATRAAVSPIQWMTVSEFLVGGIAGNVAGSFGARTLDQSRLKQIFAVFVICVGLFTGGSAVGIIPIRIH